MIDGLKPYPEYKASRVPWLPEIPKCWEVRRNGRLFAQRKETGFPDLPILEVSLKTGVRVRDFDHSLRKQMMSDRAKYQRACKGDIAYNMMRMWQGALGVVPVDGLVSPAYVVGRPYAEIQTAYFAYLYRTSHYMGEVNNYSRGIVSDRNRLYWDEFKQIPTPYPPPDEQRTIIRFLDHASMRFSRLIRVKNKLIVSLSEQKHAVIERAINLGLDPNVTLKESGIEWLGNVPAHWIVASLRFRYHQCLGKMVDANKVTGKWLVPYLRNVDVRWDSINTTDLPLIDIAPHERDRFTVKAGDLLVCEGRHLGRCAFWKGDIEVCGFQKALHRLRPLNPDADYPRFLFYCMYLASVKDAFNMNKIDNTIPHLTGVMLRAHRFAFPPMTEQQAISDYLDGALENIEKASATARAEIELLRELRTRLISDVVTGKLDVREVAANLPDEWEEALIEETDDFIESDAELESADLEEATAEI